MPAEVIAMRVLKSSCSGIYVCTGEILFHSSIMDGVTAFPILEGLNLFLRVIMN